MFLRWLWSLWNFMIVIFRPSCRFWVVVDINIVPYLLLEIDRLIGCKGTNFFRTEIGSGHPCCFLSSVEPENATGNGPWRSEGPEVFQEQDHPLLASPCYFLFLFGHFTHSFLAVFQFLCPFHDLLGDQLISTKLPADQRSAEKSAADVCPKRNNFQTLEHQGTSTSKFPHWHGADPDL